MGHIACKMLRSLIASVQRVLGSIQRLRQSHCGKRGLRFETLPSRRVFTGWIVDLPEGVSYVAIAQTNATSDVCLAYVQEHEIGTQTISPDGRIGSDRISFSGDGAVDTPYRIYDAAFTEPNALIVAGSATTESAIPGDEGEPTKWIDGREVSAGMENTTVGNNGAFRAVHSTGRLVGDDEFQPIVHESGQTKILPLLSGDAIGGATDLNEDRIVGYSNDDAVVWREFKDGYEPHELEHRDSDTFGIANSISEYGIVGGSYRRTTGSGEATVGMLWNRDGSVRREFANAEVTQLVDYFAAVADDVGTKIYDAVRDRLMALEQFLSQQGLADLPAGRADLIDLEWNNDRTRLLMLIEFSGSSGAESFAASMDAEGLILNLQHPWDRYDVNNDGSVTPLDALVVINYLARNPDHSLPSDRSLGSPFYDVDQNHQVTPRDALQVINRLARE